MQPDFLVIKHAPGVEVHAISEPGKQYVMIFTGSASDWIKLDLPKDKFHFEFIDPFTGKKLKNGFFTHKKGGIKSITMPGFDEIIALKITKM